tara:strand:+ start:237 stop:710 length:474 start_codon:yes stop_codon:yes gene_type:complete
MIDPFTAMAAATTAYKGIKKAVEFGKGISEMSVTISQFAKAASDMDFLEKKAEKPPLYKMFGDTEANALEIWTQKQKMAEMREELRSHISWHYGPSAWEAIVKIEGQQRKRQQELVYKKQEFIDNCISWAVGICLLLAGVGALVIVLFFLGVKHGKW